MGRSMYFSAEIPLSFTTERKSRLAPYHKKKIVTTANVSLQQTTITSR